ncbi:GapR family DNA-binding domain-containing protein, partial [Pseudoroseicyclus aestuarii]
MKQTAEDEAVTGKLLAAAAQELRQFVERTERLAAEKQDITDQMKEVMAEA